MTGDDEEETARERKARERMVQGSCGMRGMVPSELQAERFQVGLPDSHRYRG